MNRLLLFLVCVFAMPQMADAQVWGWFPRSSTAQEGFLRGQGAAATGQGFYLNGLGNYQVQYQQAYRAWLENEAYRIRTRRQLDAEKDLIRSQKPTFFERQMASLDAREKRILLEVRKQELDRLEEKLRKEGKLPKRKPYVYNGVQYESYSAFKKSPAYAVKKAESDRKWEEHKKRREAEEAAKQKRIDEAAEWLRDWNSKSSGERMILSERRKRNQRLRKIMGEEYYQKYLKKD